MRWMAFGFLCIGAQLFAVSPELEQAVPPELRPALPEETYLSEFDRLHALLIQYRYESDYYMRRAMETKSPADARRANHLATKFAMKRREVQEQMMQLEFDRLTLSMDEEQEEVRN